MTLPRWTSLVLTALVVAVLFVATPPPSAASAMTESDICPTILFQPPGKDFWVAAPTAATASGPVVVYIHGYGSNHTYWTDANTAIEDACEAGFRVAAVDLAPLASIWSNGTQLTTLLQEITSYYNVSTVSIIAHSKGGIDTQTSIVHRGGAPYIDSYIAFGSPFAGSELADLACSAIGVVLGVCTPGAYTVGTGHMSFVRAITDGQPQNDGINAFAGRGTQCSFIITCLIIPGPDDTVVAAASVWANAEDTEIIDRSDLDHFKLAQIQNHDQGALFSYLGPNAPTLPASPAVAAPYYPASSHTLRGGALDHEVREAIAVERGLTRVHFDLLATDTARVTVISPSGQRYAPTLIASAEGDILAGIHHTVTVEQPEAGLWRVVAHGSSHGAGYLLIAAYEGGLSVALNHDMHQLFAPGEALTLDLRPSVPLASREVVVTLRDQEQRVVATGTGQQVLRLPTRSGVYSVEAQLRGTLPDGSVVERTLVTSMAVVAPGESLP